MFSVFDEGLDAMNERGVHAFIDYFVGGNVLFDFHEDFIDFVVGGAEFFFVSLAFVEFGGGGFVKEDVGEFEVFSELVNFGFVEFADDLDVYGEVAVFGAVAEEDFGLIGGAEDDSVDGVGEAIEEDGANASFGVDGGELIGFPGD